MTAALPKGWDVAPIGSVARVVGGGTPPSHDPDNFAPTGDGIPWVTPADLSGYRSQSISRGARDLSETGLARCGATLMPKGTVLFSSRAPIGYVAIAANEISTNQGFKSFVLPADIDPRFAYWQLKHLKPEAEAIATGTTFKELSGAAAATLPFRIAPLPEQTRIADQLDTLLARIQACQDRLEAIPALLRRFRRAVLGAATNGSLTADWRETRETSAWVPTRIGDLLDGKPRNGYSPKSVDFETPVRSLTLSATTSGRFLSQHTKFIDESVPADSHLWLQPGDILIQRANTLEYVGVSAIFDGPPQSFIYPDLMMKCRPNSRVDGRFLYFLLSAEPTRRYFRDHATGTAGNMPKINQQTVMSVPVNLPPMDEQVEIVRRANRLLHALSQLEQRHTVAAAHTRRLTPLTLAKAFRGELVPQDPTDEPASALLTRIATQRNAPAGAATPPTARRGRPPRAPKETATMTKSRQDGDVMSQPYLAGHLRRLGAPATAEALFKVAELPIADFYKQLAWEVQQGHVKDNQTTLEPGHAAG